VMQREGHQQVIALGSERAGGRCSKSVAAVAGATERRAHAWSGSRLKLSS